MVGVFLLLCFGMGDVNCNGNSMVGCFVFGEIDVFVWLQFVVEVVLSLLLCVWCGIYWIGCEEWLIYCEEQIVWFVCDGCLNKEIVCDFVFG